MRLQWSITRPARYIVILQIGHHCLLCPSKVCQEAKEAGRGGQSRSKEGRQRWSENVTRTSFSTKSTQCICKKKQQHHSTLYFQHICKWGTIHVAASMVTDTHTHSQSDYCNPHACAKGAAETRIWGRQFNKSLLVMVYHPIIISPCPPSSVGHTIIILYNKNPAHTQVQLQTVNP